MVCCCSFCFCLVVSAVCFGCLNAFFSLCWMCLVLVLWLVLDACFMFEFCLWWCWLFGFGWLGLLLVVDCAVMIVWLCVAVI